jgi:SAM-dependent methyltransferase
MSTETLVPNHHHDYPGFSGASGLLAAASMVFGRSGDGRTASELAGVRAGDVVVDIGCGPGGATRRAAKRGATVVGVDPAPVMLRVARSLTRSRAVRFIEGSAEALPLPDDFATVIWTIASVHHWRDLDASLREVRRVLQPGGRFVAVERRTRPGADGLASHGWTDDQADAFADLCTEHGFAGTRVERPDPIGRRALIAVGATAP